MTNPFGNTPDDNPNSGNFGDYNKSSANNDGGYQSFPNSGSANGGIGAFPGGAEGSNFPQDANELATVPAGVGRRFLSLIVDNIITSIVSTLVIMLTVGSQYRQYLQDTQDYMEDVAASSSQTTSNFNPPTLPIGVLFATFIIGIAVWFLYRGLMESQFGGTVGRMATGTKVVDISTGQKLTFGKSVLRNAWMLITSLGVLINLVGPLLVLGVYIAIAVTIGRSPLNQSFTDKPANAQVILK